MLDACEDYQTFTKVADGGRTPAVHIFESLILVLKVMVVTD